AASTGPSRESRSGSGSADDSAGRDARFASSRHSIAKTIANKTSKPRPTQRPAVSYPRRSGFRGAGPFPGRLRRYSTPWPCKSDLAQKQCPGASKDTSFLLSNDLGEVFANTRCAARPKGVHDSVPASSIINEAPCLQCIYGGIVQSPFCKFFASREP